MENIREEIDINFVVVIFFFFLLLLTSFLDVSQRALTAGGTVRVDGHEDTSTAVRVRAFLLGAGDLVFFTFTITFDLVVLEDTEADVDVLVGLLDLLPQLHVAWVKDLFGAVRWCVVVQWCGVVVQCSAVW